MQEITKIVVPIDLDRHTKKLIEFSVYIAGKLSASIRLIHVVENITTGDMMVGSPSFEPIYEEQAKKAQIAVADIIEKNKTAMPDMDGTKGLERILLGSVAERVLKSVHCPTLTMNPYR
ncbi:MAG: universal stress protein [Deltaproteobacteria bacterium]|nr:universal stress protein [Deltaproteobacteria bacterium]